MPCTSVCGVRALPGCRHGLTPWYGPGARSGVARSSAPLTPGLTPGQREVSFGYRCASEHVSDK